MAGTWYDLKHEQDIFVWFDANQVADEDSISVFVRAASESGISCPSLNEPAHLVQRKLGPLRDYQFSLVKRLLVNLTTQYLAGTSAAEGIREVDKNGSVLLLGAEKDLPYDRPPLTKQLWADSKSVDEITLHDERFYKSGGRYDSTEPTVSYVPHHTPPRPPDA